MMQQLLLSGQQNLSTEEIATLRQELACCTFCFAVSIAMAGGILAALLQNRLPDKIHGLWTVLAVAVPDYWIGLMLLPTLALDLSVSAAEGWVLFARAKGLSRMQVFLGHTLKPALLPMLSGCS